MQLVPAHTRARTSTPDRAQLDTVREHALIIYEWLLLIQVDGFKRLVKDFASAVSEDGGKVIYVNLGGPTKEWDHIFDYHGTPRFTLLLLSSFCFVLY